MKRILISFALVAMFASMVSAQKVKGSDTCLPLVQKEAESYMQQAARVSDKTGFFMLGELIEFNDTKKIFLNPDKEQTQNYITGRFG